MSGTAIAPYLDQTRTQLSLAEYHDFMIDNLYRRRLINGSSRALINTQVVGSDIFSALKQSQDSFSHDIDWIALTMFEQKWKLTVR